MFLQRKNMGYNPKDEKMNQIKVPICWLEKPSYVRKTLNTSQQVVRLNILWFFLLSQYTWKKNAGCSD
jgi:hypothetical protein